MIYEWQPNQRREYKYQVCIGFPRDAFTARKPYWRPSGKIVTSWWPWKKYMTVADALQALRDLTAFYGQFDSIDYRFRIEHVYYNNKP